MIFASTVELIIELAILAFVIITLAVIGSIFIIRNLRKTFKELYRQQSKFDIELRKATNLLSKISPTSPLNDYLNTVIKELPYEQKKKLLDSLFDVYETNKGNVDKYPYLVETYDNLQESRRLLDAQILQFNQKISFFPFSVYAKIMKFKKQKTYTQE